LLLLLPRDDDEEDEAGLVLRLDDDFLDLVVFAII
jgi:hypothetical protein